MAFVAIALAGVASSRPSLAQSMCPPTQGQVSGFVRDAGSGKLVADAKVTLSLAGTFIPGSGVTSRELLNDIPPICRTLNTYTPATGAFTFQKVLPGHYSLAVRKPGYAVGYFGQQHAREDLWFFDIGQDERIAGVDLRLWPGATIAGTVRSRSGTPLAGYWLVVSELGRENGIPALRPVIRSAVVTDAQGQYRFEELLPGQYFVRVSAAEPQSPAMQFLNRVGAGTGWKRDPEGIFYPNAPLVTGATAITVVQGGTAANTDFTWPEVPGVAYRISGRVDQLKFSAAGQTVRLVLADIPEGWPAGEQIDETVIDADGSFAFDRIPPGAYAMRAVLWPGFDPRRHNPPGIGPEDQQIDWERTEPPAAWFNERVVVGGADVTGLVVHALDGARVTGRIAVSEELRNLDISQGWIAVRSLDGWEIDRLPVARVTRDGAFQSAALPPGRYVIEPRSAGNLWFSESAILNGRDTLATGVNIGRENIGGLAVTLTSVQAQLSGAVTDNAGKAVAGAHVVYLRKDGAWMAGSAGLPGPEVGFQRTSRSGLYELRLNAGTYLVAAVVGEFPQNWGDVAFLRSMAPGATEVKVSRGVPVRLPLIARAVGK